MITPIETQRLAEAFEIPGPMAVEDAASFQRWSASWAAFLAHLRQRYQWWD